MHGYGVNEYDSDDADIKSLNMKSLKEQFEIWWKIKEVPPSYQEVSLWWLERIGEMEEKILKSEFRIKNSDESALEYVTKKLGYLNGLRSSFEIIKKIKGD